MKCALALALLLSFSAYADDSANYCLDPETNQQWAKMLMDSPDDDAVAKLFALRLGLCQLVEKELITLERATSLFEAEREKIVRERSIEQMRKDDLKHRGT